LFFVGTAPRWIRFTAGCLCNEFSPAYRRCLPKNSGTSGRCTPVLERAKAVGSRSKDGRNPTRLSDLACSWDPPQDPAWLLADGNGTGLLPGSGHPRVHRRRGPKPRPFGSRTPAPDPGTAAPGGGGWHPSQGRRQRRRAPHSTASGASHLTHDRERTFPTRFGPVALRRTRG
jgi:hypothetical protein